MDKDVEQEEPIPKIGTRARNHVEHDFTTNIQQMLDGEFGRDVISAILQGPLVGAAQNNNC